MLPHSIQMLSFLATRTVLIFPPWLCALTCVCLFKLKDQVGYFGVFCFVSNFNLEIYESLKNKNSLKVLNIKR